MKEYIIYYIGFEDGQELNMVGSGLEIMKVKLLMNLKCFVII